jgi:hypothetical protein
MVEVQQGQQFRLRSSRKVARVVCLAVVSMLLVTTAGVAQAAPAAPSTTTETGAVAASERSATPDSAGIQHHCSQRFQVAPGPPSPDMFLPCTISGRSGLRVTYTWEAGTSVCVSVRQFNLSSGNPQWSPLTCGDFSGVRTVPWGNRTAQPAVRAYTTNDRYTTIFVTVHH